ncbi:MAG: undecaprenyl-diphosphatase [Deltaproteobacteria bacterium]|nr:MAG: undecaprenyl-diphosphatase [Deltaproteobacteria bacterium]
MEILKAVLLGIVQGATEFLPISSSGHLVIASEFMDFHGGGAAFNVMLHLGTLFSVCLAFRQDVWLMVKAPFALLQNKLDERLRQYLYWDLYVIIATLPLVLAALFLKDDLEQLFHSVLLVYCTLLITGLLMVITGRLHGSGGRLGCRNALIIGCAQAFAVMPGISRSGSTIFTGMLLGIERENAARFSFIMSIPAILGAAVLQLGSLTASFSAGSFSGIIAGTVAAAVTGYFAIILLMDLLKRNRLPIFGYYCFLVSALGFGHYFLIK